MQKLMNIVLKPSKLRSYYFSFIFISGAVLVLLLNLHWYWLCVATLLIVVGRVYAGKGQSAQHLQKISSDNWQVEYTSGKIISGKLQGSSISTAYFSILILKSTNPTVQLLGFPKKVLVFNDMLPPKDYHLLRLHLKGLLN